MSANPYSPPMGGMGGSYPMGGASAAPMAGVGPTEMSVELLRQTRPWVLFLSVMTFLGAGGMFLMGLGMLVMGAFAGKAGGLGGAVPAAIMGAVYLPMGFMYLYPGIKMWQYGSAIGRLVANRSNEELEAALGHQKSLWKYSGILTLVMIVMYFLAVVGMVIVGIAGASRMH